MDKGLKLLSDATIHSKYARYRDDLQRRETYEEIVTRNKNMHLKKFPDLKETIEWAYKFVYERKVLPSMRSMQFAGPAMEANEARGFNCSYVPVDHPKVFSEVMFLLLGGTGVGYSVEDANISQLPSIRTDYGAAWKLRNRTVSHKVADSIEGWSDAIDVLFSSRFYDLPDPIFDYSEIREKGERLITSGGRAPGAAPLKDCLEKLTVVLDNAIGRQLTSLEVHDCMCIIADAVLAGGIRRAAMISFFDKEDELMGKSKSGDWWIQYPYRARANNSMVAYRPEFILEDFKRYWSWVQESKSGEPGLFWTNSKTMRGNPCVEAGLEPRTFCNLAELNCALISNQDEYNQAARAAAIIGTLQASYTNFHFLRPEWREATERDALIGVGLTGIANRKFLDLDHRRAAKIVVDINALIAKRIGINPAARCTLIKPSGTTSIVLGCSSGIHAWHSLYFLRRIRLGKNEALYRFLLKHIPWLIEDDLEKPRLQAVVSIPCKIDPDSITRDESALDLLGRVHKFYEEWVYPGWNRGENPHSISVTVSIKDHEWDEVGSWLWDHRNEYACASVLPYDGGTYKQAPFEEITQEMYEKLTKDVLLTPEYIAKSLPELDFSEVLEFEDNTSLVEEVACANGACEVKYF